MSSKEEFLAPESFVIDPVDLNGFVGDDGRIYGFEGLKVRFVCCETILFECFIMAYNVSFCTYFAD